MEVLVKRILAWAKSNENVTAVIATGSYSRGKRAVDEYSDYDVEIIAKDPVKLSRNDQWLRSFGKIWVSEYFDEGQSHPTRLIYYEGGRKVDFTLVGQQRLTDMARHGLDDLYRRGYKVLLDKDGSTNSLPAAAGSHPANSLPTKEQFVSVIQEFWFEAMHIPKYLAREDLWVVKFRDWTMKETLLKMLEWHSLATHKGNVEVSHIGSKMRRWVDDTTWTELQAVYGHFDASDSWRSLLAETKLFRRLTRETASLVSLDYPADIERNVMGHIQKMAPQSHNQVPDK